MRIYNFLIKNAETKDTIKEFYAGKSMAGDKIGVNGLNIAFEIQIFSENFAQMPCQIRLDNAFDIDSYKELMSYPYLEMEFYAFWLENSPLIIRNGYDITTRHPLIKAPITNAIPDFSNITKSVYFHYNPNQSMGARRLATQQNKRFSYVLQRNTTILPALTSYFENLINPYNKTQKQMPTIEAMSDEVNNVVWQGGDTIISGDTIAEFMSNLTNLEFRLSGEIVKLMIFLQTENKILIGLSKIVEKSAGTTLDNPIELKPQDFLIQPNLTSIIGSLNIVIRLRQDLRLGNYVRISGAKLQTSGIATKVSTGVSLNNPTLTAGVIYADNVYQITAINHMGEYYDTSANSWSSQITLKPANEDTSSIYIRKDG